MYSSVVCVCVLVPLACHGTSGQQDAFRNVSLTRRAEKGLDHKLKKIVFIHGNTHGLHLLCKSIPVFIFKGTHPSAVSITRSSIGSARPQSVTECLTTRLAARAAATSRVVLLWGRCWAGPRDLRYPLRRIMLTVRPV